VSLIKFVDRSLVWRLRYVIVNVVIKSGY